MTALDEYEDLRARGLTLRIQEGDLKLKGPKNLLNENHRLGQSTSSPSPIGATAVGSGRCLIKRDSASHH
jgi:hypothetical protein